MSNITNKREALLDEIAPLFFNNGYWKMKVDDIASTLNISKKTLYVYFEDKKDIIRQVIKRRINSVEKIAKESEANNSNAVEELYETLVGFYSIVDIDKDEKKFADLKKYYNPIYHEKINGLLQLIRKIISRNCERGQREGLYKPELDPEMVGGIFATMYLNNRTGNSWLKKNESLNSLKTNTLRLLIYGMVTDEGKKIVENTFKIIP